MHTYIYVYIYICLYIVGSGIVNKAAYIHTYIHTYICTYIHTYIHIYNTKPLAGCKKKKSPFRRVLYLGEAQNCRDKKLRFAFLLFLF